jgi:hypothetical protein
MRGAELTCRVSSRLGTSQRRLDSLPTRLDRPLSRPCDGKEASVALSGRAGAIDRGTVPLFTPDHGTRRDDRSHMRSRCDRPLMRVVVGPRRANRAKRRAFNLARRPDTDAEATCAQGRRDGIRADATSPFVEGSIPDGEAGWRPSETA